MFIMNFEVKRCRAAQSITVLSFSVPVTILQEFCLESGMMINRSETKFMVINGTSCDKLPLVSKSLIE